MQAPLADLLPLVGGGMLSSASEQRRGLEVVLQLRRSEALSAREAVAIERRRRALHTPERACCHCFRRIGNTVVVSYPAEHALAHYHCHNAQLLQQKQREGGRNSSGGGGT